jgi:dipeptidase E
MKILALSSSKAGNSGYLEKAADLIEDVLDNQALTIAFIPFASVEKTYDEFGGMVRTALRQITRHHIEIVKEANAKSLLEQCDAVMVGGGNTFKLLHHIYQYDLFDLINKKVRSGTPYIGWSAGSNLTGKTICTTNDMPIIQPKSFDAFGFFPFQINPHYINQATEGFHGETRDQRLSEFIYLNPKSKILGLPEGTALQLTDKKLHFIGPTPGAMFSFEQGKVLKDEIPLKQDLSYLLTN